MTYPSEQARLLGFTRRRTPLQQPSIHCRMVPRGVKPDNDNRPVEQPVAIVTARRPRGRKAAWTDDGAETPESVKAFLARMVRPGGSLPPGAAE